MGLISRVSSRTYRLSCKNNKNNRLQKIQQCPPNSLSPTPPSSSKTKAWTSPPTTCRLWSKLPEFPLNHSGLVSSKKPCLQSTSLNSSPTSDPVSALPLLVALLKLLLRRNLRKKNLKKSPILIWVLICLDKKIQIAKRRNRFILETTFLLLYF